MCNKVVHMDLWLLKYAPDWFVVLQEMWYEDFDDDGDDDDDDDDEIVEWCNAYIKCKAQKAQIKKGFMPSAWHPDRVMDWCLSEDEKRW